MLTGAGPDLDAPLGLDTAELARRARRVRLLLTDVDGVLTDAGVYYSSRGEELKRFSVRDGMGVELLREAGIETAFLTRENSEIVVARAKKLALEKVYLGVRDKRAFVLERLTELGVTLERIAYIGDDVNDVPLLELVSAHGLSGAPRDADARARRHALFSASVPGGHGAFRQFADFMLELRRKETP